MKLRNHFVAGLASTMLLAAGCSTEDSSVTPFDWTISEGNAVNVVSKVFSYQDSEADATNTITQDPATGLKAANGQKFFTTDSPIPCGKSGTLSSTFTGNLLSDFDWTLTFASCDGGDGEGPVSGSLAIGNMTDTPSLGDNTGTIDLNLTSQGFTIYGDIDSTLYNSDLRNETSFLLSITASGGTLSAATDSNFVTYFGDLHPSTGSMIIAGPLGNELIVTAMGSYVQIEVDIGGDGLIEDTQLYLWTEL